MTVLGYTDGLFCVTQIIHEYLLVEVDSQANEIKSLLLKEHKFKCKVAHVILFKYNTLYQPKF